MVAMVQWKEEWVDAETRGVDSFGISKSKEGTRMGRRTKNNGLKHDEEARAQRVLLSPIRVPTLGDSHDTLNCFVCRSLLRLGHSPFIHTDPALDISVSFPGD